MPQFPNRQKPRYSAVFTRHINVLTSAVFVTDEHRGFDQAYQPHLNFSQTSDDLPFEGRDGNVKILQCTAMHHFYQKYLVEKILIKYDVNSSARDVPFLHTHSFEFHLWKDGMCKNISVKPRFRLTIPRFSKPLTTAI
jgi:hypothetical protein